MRRPNILILYTDQQRYDAVGANGNPEIKTPNLDRLAAEGINYSRFFVQGPVCMPSRMSFLSGLYPSTLGVSNGGIPMLESVPTVATMFGQYGYVTANIGKLHFLPKLGRDSREAHPSYGFDHLEVADGGGKPGDAYTAWKSRKASPAEAGWFIEKPEKPSEEESKQGGGETIIKAYSGSKDSTFSAFVAEQTIGFMRCHRHQPFLCIGSFIKPHPPWIVPQEFLDLYDPAKLTPTQYPADWQERRTPGRFDDATLRRSKQGYYACVSEVDYYVGQILACLKELDLERETIVVFTSDHGEWLGEYLKFQKGYPADDAVSRVPCIIRNGQGGPAGVRIDDIVEALDIVPTVLSWAGIQPPPHLQGRPLELDGRSEAPRTSALTEGGGWKTLRLDQTRYLCHGDGREMLHDLSKPFGQYKDVAADPEYAAALMTARKELSCRLIQRERFRPRIAAY